jgi:hypothetical protein
MPEAQETGDYVALAAETAVGDVRDHLLQHMQHNHSALPWNMRTEAQQREVAENVERFARFLVNKLCATIAAQGQKAAKGRLERLTTRNGVVMTINVSSSDPLRHELLDRVGGSVMVVLTQAEEMSGERAPVRIKPDQQDLLDAAE